MASGDIRLPRFLRREAGAELDRLYRRHADEVFRYALMVMRSRPDAEDVSQIVFVRALKALERGEQVRTPRNWLIKIAHNECRRLLSSRKVHAELPEDIAVEPIERADVTRFRKAMEALPAAQRKALCLRELEGRTYVEIATELDLSVSAVETLIFRARRTLREQLEAAMSCEDFALLLDDPDARTRVRAHARICPECATLERQARGRKSALKRIASMFGLPWWGAKLAAVGLTAATVAAVAAAVPAAHRPPAAPTPQPGAGAHVSAAPHRFAPRPVVAAHRVSGTPRVSDTRSATAHAATPNPAPAGLRPVPSAPPTTPAPQPAPPTPAEPLLPPAAATPAAPAAPAVLLAAVAPAVTAPPVPAITAVTVPALPVPAVTDPAVPGPVSAVPALPTVSAPVATPNVSLP